MSRDFGHQLGCPRNPAVSNNPHPALAAVGATRAPSSPKPGATAMPGSVRSTGGHGTVQASTAQPCLPLTTPAVCAEARAANPPGFDNFLSSLPSEPGGLEKQMGQLFNAERLAATLEAAGQEGHQVFSTPNYQSLPQQAMHAHQQQHQQDPRPPLGGLTVDEEEEEGRHTTATGRRGGWR